MNFKVTAHYGLWAKMHPDMDPLTLNCIRYTDLPLVQKWGFHGPPRKPFSHWNYLVISTLYKHKYIHKSQLYSRKKRKERKGKEKGKRSLYHRYKNGVQIFPFSFRVIFGEKMKKTKTKTNNQTTKQTPKGIFFHQISLKLWNYEYINICWNKTLIIYSVAILGANHFPPPPPC